MPAITKDAALRNLGHIAEELGKAQSSAVMVNRLIEVVGYITEAAATQASEKPQDGLVNPPSRAEPASQHYVDSATVIDVRYEFERWMSGRGEAAEYICDGLYSDGAVQDQAEAFAAGVALSGGFREGRNAQPDSSQDLAPTDLSAVEVPPTDAARDVLAERRRQIEQEGWAPEQDDGYEDGQLSMAAAMYAMQGDSPNLGAPDDWPWNPNWWKPSGDRRNLVKAGALILADIERIDRASMKGNK